MPSNIHKQRPNRTCTKVYSDFHKFKLDLQKDFHCRCGYCDAHDRFFAGHKNFQIDHFKPHSIKAFKSLKHEYQNLIYSCQSCNRAKSNTWRDQNGFLDPCDPAYEQIIFRDDNGKIDHNGTDQAVFIYVNLNLGLLRHEILWKIEKLEAQCEEVKELIETGSYDSSSHQFYLLKEFMNIQLEIKKYMNSLYIELSH